MNIDTVERYIKQLCGDSELGILSSVGSDDEQKPWEHKRQQQELTSLDFTDTVRIVKANMLHIDKSGISQNALNRIKRLGAFRNPDFYKAQAMRLPTYNKPRIIDTTEETEKYLSTPPGGEDDLLELLNSANTHYEIDGKRNPGKTVKVDFNGTLRPEQETAANALLQHDNGILSATTAFGKTVVGSYIISQRKVNTLIPVHTSALLDQWKKSLSQFLIIDEPIDDKDFGITRIYSAIAENEPRNRLIITDVTEALKKGRTPIVLTQRSDHVTLLADALDKSCSNVIRLIGKNSAKEKREVLEQLHSLPKDQRFVIVATGKYVGEGFDETRLDTLFLAAPISWKGTLQQYAGRLHRSYEGKENVIVYDYVDVHIKMLENMYHKRVSGYSGMGYKALNEGSVDEKIGVIFDNHSFLPVFEKDIQSARHEIVICSPFLRKARTVRMMGILSLAKTGGIRVTVVTSPAESYKLTDQPGIITLMQSLSDSGIMVIQKPNIHQKFAVIDQNIVWYGSINLLSYGTAEESIMRFENMEIAGELLTSIE